MAINLQTLKTRALTALVFVVAMLAGLLWNGWLFILLFTVIHFGCWLEFIRLMKKTDANTYVSQSLLGLVYITMPVLMMLDLGINTRTALNLDYSPLIPCAIIFSLWINDTMAYLVGSMIGKTPFSNISPKKTWEGTSGGVILCIMTIGLLGYLIPAAKVIKPFHWIMIGAICSVMGTAGDLLESKIKRMASVKDSGSIMPGHGGFLDRFDSLLVAVPFVWMYVKLIV